MTAQWTWAPLLDIQISGNRCKTFRPLRRLCRWKAVGQEDEGTELDISGHERLKTDVGCESFWKDKQELKLNDSCFIFCAFPSALTDFQRIPKASLLFYHRVHLETFGGMPWQASHSWHQERCSWPWCADRIGRCLSGGHRGLWWWHSHIVPKLI